MTVAVTSASSTSSGTDAATLGQTQLSTSYDTFLKLLTTQLQNQDPMSPLDSNQFTQQLVQMTGVQQQLYSNDLLKQLVSNTGSGISDAVSVIGKEARADMSTTNISGGKANWGYNLKQAAASVRLEVLDSQGRIVHVETKSNLPAGEQSLTWSGSDLQGRQLPDGGPYKLNVVATDSSAGSVASSVFVRGLVSGVEQVAGKPVLTINGASVPWASVTAVSIPKSSTPA